jgi:putative inorganic carbon (hco3(-)) transporter
VSKLINNAVPSLFIILFFFAPLIFYPKTSEIFEFNKMVFTYLITVLISGSWLIKMIYYKRFIFTKTPLFLPMMIFLATQLFSTLISLDRHTSIFGYYSRFHGGLLSTITYTILYFAYVSNMNRKNTFRIIIAIIASTLIVSIWGILERTGHSIGCLLVTGSFDVDCWIQNVRERVFATFGQPNWLAAWLAATIPLATSFILIRKNFLKNHLSIKSRFLNLNMLLGLILIVIFFITLLFTKSRSGILGYLLANTLFWLLLAAHLARLKRNTLNILIAFLFVNITLLILILTIGTPVTPKLSDLISGKSPASQPTWEQPPVAVGENKEPVFHNPDEGGTDSGVIRKILWKGTIDVWKSYPILGSGVETLAFSYYQHRPMEHNLVSEWNFLYNKAHNEYLNFLATTGILGLLGYLTLIAFSIFQILNYSHYSKQSLSTKSVRYGLLAGYFSILVTNFFGFSVVPVALLFFLFPAMAFTLGITYSHTGNFPFTSTQKILAVFVVLFTSYMLHTTAKYWLSDYYYSQAKQYNINGDHLNARKLADKSIKLSPNQANYWDELSSSTAGLALLALQANEPDLAKQLADSAVNESLNSINLSPAHTVFRKNHANVLIKLSDINPEYLNTARNTLADTTKLAPTDANLFYNLSIAYIRTGEKEMAIKTLERTVFMKPDYKDARFALSVLYIDKGAKKEAITQLNFILENIDPNDERTKLKLKELE